MSLSEARLTALITSIDAQISKRTKDYYKDDRHRLLLATKYGADRVFLDPVRHKFVLINPTNGQYDCNLCFLAVIKSLWNLKRNTKLPSTYYQNMLEKGKELFKSIGCKDKLTVKLPNNFDMDDIS